MDSTPATPASAMTRRLPILEDIKIATPCSADWNAMTGDAQVRFCGQCSLHVYNLSAMGRDEAEALIARTEGRVCVRLYKRQDGTVITQDCPRGLERVRRRMRIIAGAVAGVLSAYLGLDFLRPATCTPPTVEAGGMEMQPHPMMGDVAPDMGKPMPPPQKLMGKMARPSRR